MRYLENLGVSICILITYAYILSSAFLEPSFFRTVVVFFTIGVALHYLSRNLTIEDHIDRLDLLFLSSSILAIIAGTSANILRHMLFQIAHYSNALAMLTELFSYQPVLLNIGILLPGLFLPSFALGKQPVQVFLKPIKNSLMSAGFIFFISVLLTMYVGGRIGLI